MALQQTYDNVTIPFLEDGDHCTEDEYFAFSEHSEYRWEFIPDQSEAGEPLDEGVIRAITGGTADHSGIAGNLITVLNIALRGAGRTTCRVFGSDLRIRTAEGRNTFPDVSIICGPINYHRNRRDTVLDPIFLAEVLSPSTKNYDRGEKRLAYQTIPALEHYLLIEPDTPSVEVITRVADGWQSVTVAGIAERVSLPKLGIEIASADVYALVEFDEGGS